MMRKAAAISKHHPGEQISLLPQRGCWDTLLLQQHAAVAEVFIWLFLCLLYAAVDKACSSFYARKTSPPHLFKSFMLNLSEQNWFRREGKWFLLLPTWRLNDLKDKRSERQMSYGSNYLKVKKPEGRRSSGKFWRQSDSRQSVRDS